MRDPAVLNGVVVGLESEYFLNSPHHRTLEVIAGEFKPDALSVRNLTENIRTRGQSADKLNAKYFHLCAPDKHMVYNALFPLPIKFAMAEAYLHSYPKLFEYPKTYLQSYLPERTYRKVDTHWNILGRILISIFVAHRFGVLSSDILKTNEKWLRNFIEIGPNQISGDLGSKLTPQETELGDTFKPNWEYISYTNGISNGNDGMLELILSKCENSKGRLLIFGDSFIFQCLPMLSAYFREILCCRTRYWHAEIANAARPDFILTENVERYFTSTSSDNEAPPFFLYPHLLGRGINMNSESAQALAYILTHNPSKFLRGFRQ